MANDFITDDFLNFLKNINNFNDEGIEADEFIKNHNHICYCEAIIYPDGKIVNVKPSHTETLLRISKIPRDIFDEITIVKTDEGIPFGYLSPISVLINYTKCIALWYNSYLRGSNITKEQLETINALSEAKVISSNLEVTFLRDKLDDEIINKYLKL